MFLQGFVYFDIMEKVPFRLTQNIVDGFGITGLEGVFRRCCETTLRILRENKNSLLSVLESFIHDPLLELHLVRPGPTRKSVGSARGDDKAKREEEARKEEARGALQIMSNKLKGLQATTKGEPKETVTAVEMTVENLFKEATDPRNLGGMYCGWSAWM
jgi:serine/threonine-protein kinase ATR